MGELISRLRQKVLPPNKCRQMLSRW